MLTKESQVADLWKGTRGRRDADIMIVGESWGQNEKIAGKPLVGASGIEFERMLAEANLPPLDECFVTNVVNAKPPGNDMSSFFWPSTTAVAQRESLWRGLYPKPVVLEGLRRLYAQIEAVKPKIIIGLGTYTLWALTEDMFTVSSVEGWKVPAGIMNWRGSQIRTNTMWGNIPPIPFLPIVHPAAILRNWAWRSIAVHDLGRVRYAFEGTWDPPKDHFLVAPDFFAARESLLEVVRRLRSSPTMVSIDIETRDNFIACIGFALDVNRAFCIPILSTEKQFYWDDPALRDELWYLIQHILKHPNIRITGQNFLYDAQFLALFYMVIPHISYDTMVLHHLCWPGGGNPMRKSIAGGITRKDLSTLSSLYCRHHRYWKDEGKTWEKNMNERQLWEYNCRDAASTYEITQELQNLVVELDLVELAEFQMKQLNKLALPMMLRGMKIDRRRRAEVTMELAAEIETRSAELDRMIPEDVFPRDGKGKPWYRSPQKQQKIFYDILGIKPVKHPKTKKNTLGKNALPILARREPLVRPILDKLEELRRLGVFSSTFCQAALSPDGRLRSTFSPTGTETFRWSSSKDAFGSGANLQNIPKGTEDAEDVDVNLPNVRRFFVPDTDHELLEVDLSGADARVVAWEADDEDLKAAFGSGVNIHIKNARDLFPYETQNMTDAQIKATDFPGGLYHNCKRRVHGTNYVASPKTLATVLKTSIAEEEEFQARWFHLHPGIQDWHHRVETMLQESRSVSNKFGFRVYYFDRIEHLLPQALAWIPQSTVAINCIAGGLAVVERCPWVEPLLQVHDSFIFQYRKADRSKINEIRDALHSVVVPYDDPLCIPWTAAISTKSWGDVEAIDWKA